MSGGPTPALSPEQWARAWELRQGGMSWKGVLRELDWPCTVECIRKYRLKYGDPVDPTPQPYGCPPKVTRRGETPEDRAFRRFPITFRGTHEQA